MEQILVFQQNLHDEFLPFLGSSIQLGQDWIVGNWKTNVISQKVIRWQSFSVFWKWLLPLAVVREAW